MTQAEPAPVLHLSGPRLARSFETLVGNSEDTGGVERYIDGLRTKVAVFQAALTADRIADLDQATFLGLCAFMASARRRVAPWLADAGMDAARRAIAGLLDGAEDTADPAAVDARMARFAGAVGRGKGYRWTRDLGAEILHCLMPERYPLMTRWVWDHAANTGVLREIWHGDVDHDSIAVPDNYQTFLVLRQELSRFLSANGVYRDVPFYVDLLCAQVYADYICAQGGSFLRTEFASEQDPLQYTRRMLGLDAVDPETGRTRVKGPDGRPLVLDLSETRH